jgi:uncharacterized membrane protein
MSLKSTFLVARARAFKSLIVAEDGVVSAFVVGLMMTFIVCAAFGVDGGRLVATRLELADHAENAARIGAQEITDLRSGRPKIDQNLAQRSSTTNLVDQDLNYSVSVSSNSVTVTAIREVEMTLLKLFGVRNYTISVIRTAEPRDE